MPPPPLPDDFVVTRSGRVASRHPKRCRDVLPARPPVVTECILSTPNPIRRVTLHVRDFMRTVANAFSLLREYHHCPSYDPDQLLMPVDLANFNASDNSTTSTTSVHTPHNSHPPPPWPFENMSKFLLMNWANSGSSQKTEAELTRLGREVLSSPDFKSEDLGLFDAHRENKRMDEAFAAMESETPFSRDGWREAKVDIQIPVASRAKKPPPPSRTFSIPGFHHRSLVEVIKAAWSESMAKRFHLSPFKRIHVDPQTKAETRVYDEAYTSDVWIEAHDNLQKQPNEPGCQLEKVIAGLMFWSDSTHLTSFGTAKVWPLYLYFGNLSKYVRARPNSGACHHVAYIPYVNVLDLSVVLSIAHEDSQIPDSIDEILVDIAPKTRRAVLKAHCRRELMHEIWRILLDDDFLYAYQHGIVILCADGVQRRVYPRIFTYSADYPEK